MRFKKGFTYLNKPYGWHKKKLYKLPYKHHNINRWYDLLECAEWWNTNKTKQLGYFLGNQRKSSLQLKQMTGKIKEVNLKINKDSDCPF